MKICFIALCSFVMASISYGEGIRAFPGGFLSPDQTDSTKVTYLGSEYQINVNYSDTFVSIPAVMGNNTAHYNNSKFTVFRIKIFTNNTEILTNEYINTIEGAFTHFKCFEDKPEDIVKRALAEPKAKLNDACIKPFNESTNIWFNLVGTGVVFQIVATNAVVFTNDGVFSPNNIMVPLIPTNTLVPIIISNSVPPDFCKILKKDVKFDLLITTSIQTNRLYGRSFVKYSDLDWGAFIKQQWGDYSYSFSKTNIDRGVSSISYGRGEGSTNKITQVSCYVDGVGIKKVKQIMCEDVVVSKKEDFDLERINIQEVTETFLVVNFQRK